MRAPLAASATTSLFLVLMVPRLAYGTDYWVGPPGVANGNGSQGSPFSSIRNAATRVVAGDTVHIHGGVYNESVSPANGGSSSSAWVTFEAVAGELPILDGGASGGLGTGFSTQGMSFVRVIGIASRRWQSTGLDNGFNTSGNNVQFINCIADENGINGIAFYHGTGVLIQNSIIAHNGNRMPSWSSGVNVFQVTGTFQDNQIIGNVSFENIDITTTHSNPAGGPTDGSGFILDQNSTGALFENNIGFRNGGSCIRLTNSPAAHLINNTCYHDAADSTDLSPSNPAEIFFSQPSTTVNVVVANNLLAAATNNSAINATSGTGSTFVKNLSVATGFVSAAAADFHLTSTATGVVDQGDVANAPSSDIGFDPKCLTQTAQVPVLTANGFQAIPWASFYVDYNYIATVAGGVAGCFHAAVRPQGNGPDVGAYEFGGVLVGGSSSGGGAGSSSGGTTSSSSGSSGGGSSGGSGGGSSGGARDGGVADSSGGSGGGSNGSSSGGVNGGSSGGSSGVSSGSTGGAGGGSGSGSATTSSGGAGSSGGSSGGATSSDSGTGAVNGFDAPSAKGCACSTVKSWPDPSALLLVGLSIAAAGARRRGRRDRKP
jgi:Right handed beta helix region